jgi:hypothetical protein
MDLKEVITLMESLWLNFGLGDPNRQKLINMNVLRKSITFAIPNRSIKDFHSIP